MAPPSPRFSALAILALLTVSTASARLFSSHPSSRTAAPRMRRLAAQASAGGGASMTATAPFVASAGGATEVLATWSGLAEGFSTVSLTVQTASGETLSSGQSAPASAGAASLPLSRTAADGEVLRVRALLSTGDPSEALPAVRTFATTVSAHFPGNALDGVLHLDASTSDAAEAMVYLGAKGAAGGVLTVSWAGLPALGGGEVRRLGAGVWNGDDSIAGFIDVSTSADDSATLDISPCYVFAFTDFSDCYVTVLTEDASGAEVSSIATRVQLDLVEPTLSVVDGAYTLSGESASVRCLYLGEDDIAVHSLLVGLGSYPGGTDIEPFQVRESNDTSITYTFDEMAVPPTTGDPFHCTVRAFDLGGNEVELTSAGLRYDDAVPVPGLVLDGDRANTDIDVQAADDSIAVSWRGWDDLETQISTMQWAVGTSTGRDDVLPWTEVVPGLGSSAVEGVELNSTLEPGTMYYSTLLAVDQAGYTVMASSDGFTVAPRVGDNGTLETEVAASFIPATATVTGDWCECADANAAYDAMDAACKCLAGFYLDPFTSECASCPAGTCKKTIGNALDLCVSSCSGDDETPQSAQSGLSTCAPAPIDDAVDFVSLNGACVCPAGSYITEVEGVDACLPCIFGEVQPFAGNRTFCSSCISAGSASTTATVGVRWSAAAAAAAAGSTAASIVVELGVAPELPSESVNLLLTDSVVQFPTETSSSTVSSVTPTSVFHNQELFASVFVVRDSDGSVIAHDVARVAPFDLSSPTRGIVSDGYSLSDREEIASLTELATTWGGFGDLESNITHYTVAFGTSAHATDLSGGFVDVGKDQQYVLEDQSLTEGMTVFSTVRAHNMWGAYTEVSSDGAVVTVTLPAGAVIIVPASDMLSSLSFDPALHDPLTTSASVISAIWSFADAAAISTLHYEAAVVDAAGEVVSNVTSTAETYAEWTGLNLMAGESYTVVVTATSLTNLTVTAESSASMVDDSHPHAMHVAVAATAAASVDEAHVIRDETAFVNGAGARVFQARTDTAVISWSFQDNETDIQSVRIALTTTEGGDDGLEWFEASHSNGAGEHTATGLELVDGRCYIATAVAVNAAGLRSPTASSGESLCIDTTPPAMEAYVDQALYGIVLDLTAFNGTDSPAALDLAAKQVQSMLDLSEYEIRNGLGTVYVPRTENFILHAKVYDPESLRCCLSWALSTSEDPTDAGEVVVSHDLEYMVAIDGRVNASVPTAGIPEGVPLFVHGTGFNAAGVEATSVSIPFVLDSSGPQGTIMMDDVSSFAAAGPSEIHCSIDFTEEESVIVGYVSVVEASDGSYMSDAVWHSPSTVEFVLDVESPVINVEYTVWFTACNAAGLCTVVSNGTLFDMVPPVEGVVYPGERDTAFEAAACASYPCNRAEPVLFAGNALTGLVVSFGSFHEPGLPIGHYELSIGRVPNGAQFGGPYRVADGVHTLDLGTLSDADLSTLNHRGGIFVTVVAVSGGGWRVATTAQVGEVDRLAPKPADVVIVGTPVAESMILEKTDPGGFDIPEVPLGLQDPRATQFVSQESLIDLAVNWEEFKDDNEVVAYHAELFALTGLGDDQTLTSIAESSDLAASVRSYDFTGLDLSPGVRYTVLVTANDEAGNAVANFADRPIIPDVSPPFMAGVVRDGVLLGSDSDCQQLSNVDPEELPELLVHPMAAALVGAPVPPLLDASTTTGTTLGDYALLTTLGAHWTPFRDPESGVELVQAGVGSSPGDDDLMSFTDVPNKASIAHFVIPQQPEGFVAYISVRARNALGQWSDVSSSDGIRMLCGAGTIGCDYDGLFICLAGRIVSTEIESV